MVAHNGEGTGCLPIVKWAGGKRGQSREIAAIARRHLAYTGGRYIELFAGGAAVALELALPDMLLNDGCGPLMDTYASVCAEPALVIRQLEGIVRMHGVSLDAYNLLRAQQPAGNPYYDAARFLYLNTTNFNGLYRENAKGAYNVPYGHPRRPPAFLTLDEARAFRAATLGSTFMVADFRDAIVEAGAGSFVFCDPPYLGGFSDYLAGGFTRADHQDLADQLLAASDSGVAWLQTNSDTPEIRKLYQWAHYKPTTEARAINSDSKARGKVPCLWIASHKELLTAPTDADNEVEGPGHKVADYDRENA